jgi:hypothetical protein
MSNRTFLVFIGGIEGCQEAALHSGISEKAFREKVRHKICMARVSTILDTEKRVE